MIKNKKFFNHDESPFFNAFIHFGMASFDGNIRKKDLKVDSPYNTYKYRGLPPGPIASPGIKSIIAPLEPGESDYLYFVSRKDGSHQFSSNLLDQTKTGG